MSEPKKRGRPKKTDQLNNSNNLRQKDVSDVTAVDVLNDGDNLNDGLKPKPKTNFTNFTKADDGGDLKSFLKNKKMSDKQNGNNTDIDSQTLKEIEEFESQEGLNDIPSEDFNPLNEAVKERTYTGGMTSANLSQNQERIIEEPNYRSTGANKLEVDKDLINPNNNDIPADNSNGGNGGNSGNGGGNQNNSNSGSNSGSNNSGSNSSANSDKGENIKELSAKEKREAVEGTADAILLAYRNYIPLPFVYFSQYDGKKLEKLHNEEQINLETQVKRDGTTFREYTKEFNEKVEKAFEVSDDEVQALKDPLVDVLMEKEIAFTPTQRLMFVGGQFLVAKVMMCVKFLREKKSDIEEMKTIHRENMDAMREQFRRDDEKKRTAKNTTAPPKTTIKEDSDKKSDDDDADIVDAKIVSEEKNVTETNPSLEDALELKIMDDDTNDIPD